ncbi:MULTISPECIES: hypothetical protein [unclassified Leucobacter]|uniref:hypothetical protein n=1 Tax=unclassified Leucobacter TaxID=2621730 RepID=UPI00165E977B|nr:MULTISPECIES: hypothetical protein [unclassified Leucobacter]MBC9936380.1 hypothetical protein [Leucobacter sp. cx-87]
MIDVWVTGSSLSALDAALAFAEVGLRVRVSVDQADISLPVGPQRDSDGALAALVARVGAELPGESAVLHPAPELSVFPPSGVLLRGVDGALHPLEATAVLGIPTTPLAESTIALLGGGGAFRAYLDRLRPLLKIGKEQRLGPLVRSRLGTKVERVLVDPIVRERVGVPASEVDTARLAPGLNETLSRVGSLSGAALSYGDRNVARETTVEPVGGWGKLREAMLARLALYSVELVADRPVVAIGRPTEGSGWLVRCHGAEPTADEHVRAVVIDVADSTYRADALGFAEDPVLTAADARAYVEIGIQRPAWLPPVLASDDAGADALPVLLALDGLAESVVGWTARLAPHEGAWRVRFSGPRHSAGTRHAKPDVAALCAAAEVAELPAEGDGRLEWSSVASPLSIPDEHARLGAIAKFDVAHAALRPTGAAWAGGDWALAVGEARPRMIELRRTLLGLA